MVWQLLILSSALFVVTWAELVELAGPVGIRSSAYAHGVYFIIFSYYVLRLIVVLFLMHWLLLFNVTYYSKIKSRFAE